MATRLRILSANLLNGGASPRAFANLVDTLQVDVAAVQEIAPKQAAALAEVLPFGNIEAATDCSGMGIALRRPGTIRRIPLPCRDARVVELRPEDWRGLAAPLEIINLHVAAPHDLRLWTMLQRRGQWQGVRRYLQASNRAARVVIGDLNSTPSWPWYRRLASLLTDAAIEAARGNGGGPEPTWGPRPWGPRPGARRVLRIDHAFVSGVTVQDFRVVPVAGSDHSAIVVDVLAAADDAGSGSADRR